MNFHLDDDKMLLKKLTNKAGGGLIIPGWVNVAYSMFEIVAIGPGHYDTRVEKIIPNPVKVGDKILANIGVCKEVVVEIEGKQEKLWFCPTAVEAICVLDNDETI